jgi:hypothetical protein
MRVMVIVKANEESERGAMPPTEMLQTMADYNDELVKAGVMLAADGLLPSSRGFRVSWTENGKIVRTDGPFAEAKELIAGYWIWQVRDLDEALEWIKRSPFQAPAELEIRPIGEPDDYGDAFTPEIREQERRQAEAMAAARTR